MDDVEDFKPDLAKYVAALCVRNTFLEDLHSGTVPSSKTGDFSDVKVVTPFGEIPWHELSRISDEEMKKLMKEVVDKLYTFLELGGGIEFNRNFCDWARHFVREWDEPSIDAKLEKTMRRNGESFQ